MRALLHLLRLLDPRRQLHALRELTVVLTRYRHLTLEMTRRELQERYAGQIIGTLWAVGHPLLLMGIYVFIFGYVLQIRLGGAVQFPLDYPAFLLAGLAPWLAFSDLLNKASTTIIAHAGLVKQVVFPVEVLPVKAALASLVSGVVSLCALLSYIVLKHGTAHWTWALLPLLLSFQLLAMIGAAYVLAAIGTFFRDLKDLVSVFCTANFFLIPAVFAPDSVPAVLRGVFVVNPFSYLVWCYQDAIYYGELVHPHAWLAFVLMSLLLFAAGYRLFRRLQPTFGNVL